MINLLDQADQMSDSELASAITALAMVFVDRMYERIGPSSLMILSLETDVKTPKGSKTLTTRVCLEQGTIVRHMPLSEVLQAVQNKDGTEICRSIGDNSRIHVRLFK